MAESKIEWTDRSDWNPIRGCTRISPGCGGPGPVGGCYAEAIAARFSDPGQAFHGYAERTSKGGRWTGKVALIEERLTLPLRWKKPAKVFASSTSDIFHESLSDEDIDRIFAVMALCPHLTFQVLTKRVARMREYLNERNTSGRIGDLAFEFAEFHFGRDRAERITMDGKLERFPLPNVWFGVSIEDQPRADERREDFRATPAVVKFVSYEPALGPVDWTGWEFVQQIIGGGESGPKARVHHPDWQRATRDFCEPRGIAYFFKQWGEWREAQAGDEYDTAKGRAGKPPAFIVDPVGNVHCFLPENASPRCRVMVRVGKKAAGRLLDGIQHDGMPV